MSHFGISGAYPVFACSLLLAVCVAIPILSEHEERVKLFVRNLLACVRCIARGEDL